MKTVVGLYDHIEDARDAIDDLLAAGIPRDDISLVARDVEGEYGTYLEQHGEEDVGEAAAAGAVGGAVVGGLVGLLAGIGTLAIPVVGPVVAAGPLAATLAGAGLGAAAGGLLGALVEWGIPEEEAEYYAEGVRRGGTLLAVRVSDARVDDVVDILNDSGPVDIERRAEYWRDEYGWEGYDMDAGPYEADEISSFRTGLDEWDEEDYDYDVERDLDVDEEDVTLEVAEEELAVGKRRHTRPVRVRTYVVETPVEEQVELREEHVEVERRPVDRKVGDADFEERTVEMTEVEEEAVVEKRARVIEEIVLHKEAGTRTETVRDTVRRTEVEIDEDAEAVEGEWEEEEWDLDLPDFEDLEDTFREDYEANYADTAYGYHQVRPAYLYGYDLATSPRYRDRDWADLETEAQERWEAHNEGTWPDFADAIEHGWQQVKDALGMGPYDAGAPDASDERYHRS